MSFNIKRIIFIVTIFMNAINMLNAQKPIPVNLGLPSGTLWANMNVGATIPNEYGDYYAWGEVFSKRYYGSKSTYSHFEYNPYRFSKYNYYNFPNSVVDNLLALQAVDDIATQRYGNDWRMPTADEFKELKEKCRFWKGVLNGTKGFFVVNKDLTINSDTLFLPFTGYMDNGNFRYFPATDGYYWTSTLVGEEVYDSDSLKIIDKDNRLAESAKCFVLKDTILMYKNRTIGCVIRPVYVGKRKAGK